MSLRQIANTCLAATAIALALATPAAAAAPGSDMPGGHDMRLVWQGAASAPGMPDERAREAWLRECHRRTELYYDGWDQGGWDKRRHRRDRRDHHGSAPGYSYCEAYLDDYYRTYAQPGYVQAYAVPMMAHPRPMAMNPAPMAHADQPCEEVVTTEYVPELTRTIPRRPAPRAAPGKRIRVTPDKRQRMD